MPKRILLISNGHGEDIIGAALLKDLLARANDVAVKVLPIVGEGNAYKHLPVEILGPRGVLPSGGFMRQSLRNFWMDLRAGLLGHTHAQIRLLRKLRSEVDLVLAVGDVLLVTLAGWFVKKPMVFLPTAKSEYISGHYDIEIKLMRRYASLVLPRDGKTAEALQHAGVPARFVGNAMMDSFTVKGVDFGIQPRRKVIGILPGSRAEAYQNMQMILKVVEELITRETQPYEYVTALAEQLSLEEMGLVASSLGWQSEYAATVEGTQDVLPPGVVALLKGPVDTVVKLTKGHFGDVLHKSDIFIGLAGTANEQAVGMGKPLVAFPGEGPQFNRKFLAAQKKLLGDSIAVVESDPVRIAEELMTIMHNSPRYEMMGQIGRERMGPTGGIGRMSELILRQLENQ